MVESSESPGGNWYVLLFGLPRPKSVLTLAPGVSLVPLSDPLSVFDLAAAGGAGFREWAMLEPLAGGCTCEIESAKDSEVVPGYDTLNRAWLASSLLVLRGFTGHFGVACSSYSWSQVAGHQAKASPAFRQQLEEEGIEAAIHKPWQALAPFRGNLLEHHTGLLLDRETRTDAVSETDAAWIAEHFAVFNRLASDDEAFRLALESTIDWRYAKEPRLAVGRIWGGIEAIFGIKSELVYRVSALCAALLEERGQARIDRFKATKALYSLRSKAVHGAPLTDEQVASAVNDSFRLLRELLLLTIEKGRSLTEADFEQALLG